MTRYEREIAKAEEMGLTVVDGYEFKSDLKGLLANGVVVISRKAATEREKVCILYEEVAHYKTNAGDILDQDDPNSRYQEGKAHRRMVRDNLPLERIVKTVVRLGVDTNVHEVAEALGVTEGFLREAIGVYRSEYGCRADVGPYTVAFEPFRIEKKE